jgi:hypothetical protein
MFLPEPSGKAFTPPPSGNHIAVAYRFIDLGTQLVEWQGTKKHQHKVMISFELPGELMAEGEMAGHPYTIHQRYTWSMSERSTLRKHLESWRGRAFTDEDFVGPKRFNIRNIIGKPLMLSIVHATKDGSTYANIMGVAAMPKGVPVPSHVNPLIYFALTREDFDAHVLEGLSEKLQQTIKSSPEYSDLVNGTPPKSPDAEDDFGDEVPF